MAVFILYIYNTMFNYHLFQCLGGYRLVGINLRLQQTPQKKVHRLQIPRSSWTILVNKTGDDSTRKRLHFVSLKMQIFSVYCEDWLLKCPVLVHDDKSRYLNSRHFRELLRRLFLNVHYELVSYLCINN